jgi:hypothetical protein
MPAPTPAFDNPDQLQQGIDAYFAECMKEKAEPNHVEMAVYLKVPKRTLWGYIDKPDYGTILQRAKEIIEAGLIRKLSNKDYATAGIIFNLTNNYGWKQPNQIEHSGSIAVAHSHVPPDVQNELDAHRAEIEGET